MLGVTAIVKGGAVLEAAALVLKVKLCAGTEVSAPNVTLPVMEAPVVTLKVTAVLLLGLAVTVDDAGLKVTDPAGVVFGVIVTEPLKPAAALTLTLKL